MKEIIISCYNRSDLNDAIRHDIDELRRTNIDFKVSLRESKIHIPILDKTIIYTKAKTLFAEVPASLLFYSLS